MSLDGVIYVVRLFEVMTNDITIKDSTEITWPKLLNGESPPSINGILMLYDVTNGESIIEIPDVLCKSSSTHIFEHQSSMSTHCLTKKPKNMPLSTLAANSAISDALDRSCGSIVLVSCKGDHPPQLRRVDPDFDGQIRSRFSKVEICSTSANVPESQKRCISIILRSILRCRRGKH